MKRANQGRRRWLVFLPWLALGALVGLTYSLHASHAATAQNTQRVPDLPATPFNYADPVLPAHFSSPDLLAADNTPANNPTSDAGATLGRVLFYETALSLNHSVSCASCHQQSVGFSDPSPLSVGFEGGTTARHSMTLANAVYYERGAMFWDERAASLEEQVLMPIADPVEMGLDLDEMETRLAAIDYYPDLFTAAFGDDTITQDRVSRALAQFVRSMVSADSRYDQGVASNFANFTAEEQRGEQLFQDLRCAACHETDAQIAEQPFNIGLDLNPTDNGAGNGRFKVPSLRNIEVSGPYMHDGRFDTLAEVIEFYNSGVQNAPGVNNRVNPDGLNLTQADKDALESFLVTLTDDTFLTSEQFSDPFVDVGPVVVPTACNGLAITIDMNTNGGNGSGTAGNDVILGTPGADIISGGAGDDTICALGGNDTVTGGDGIDFIFGGEGNDELSGGAGNDRIRGQQDIDLINGNTGNDFLYGGIDGDTILGGDGNDTIGGFGGDDIISGGDGNDKIFGGFGADTVQAGDGDDTVAGLAGNDEIHGEAGNDTLNGGNGQDQLYGGAGDDALGGGNSLDHLDGGPGQDTLSGGKNNDTLIGGTGTPDSCSGNLGIDTADTSCENTFGLP